VHFGSLCGVFAVVFVALGRFRWVLVCLNQGLFMVLLSFAIFWWVNEGFLGISSQNLLTQIRTSRNPMSKDQFAFEGPSEMSESGFKIRQDGAKTL